MQNNDPKHISKLCQIFIKSKEELDVLQLMFKPAQSMNLNPIELVWEEVDREVRAKQPISAVHLLYLLQESRAELSSVYRQSLAERMSRICEAVIATKGAILMNQKFKNFLWFNLYFMWLRKTCT